jgi:uncharacterized protein YqeY
MLREKLTAAMKEAMKSKDQTALSTVRLILAALKDRDIAARSKGVHGGIPDEEVLSLLGNMVKQRRDSIALYEQGNRPELAQKEKDEIAVIETFMPRQLDEAAMKEAIQKAAAATNAKTIKELGAVMAWLKQNYAGQMDFAKAATLAKQSLG